MFKNILSELEWFWATYKNSFYFGMVLCMMFIVNIPLCMPNYAGIAIAPLLSVLTYIVVWAFNCKNKLNKTDVKRSIGMSLLGSLWTLFLSVI